jgi:hypothetical protein
VHYLESGQLLCPWKERKAFLKQEESREHLVKHNDEQGYSDNSPVAHTLYQLFESVGESELSFYKGVLPASEKALDRVRTRAAMKTGTSSPYSYIDRERDISRAVSTVLRMKDGAIVSLVGSLVDTAICI